MPGASPHNKFMSTLSIIFVVALGAVVASIASLIDAHRRGQKKGEDATVARLGRLYRINRAACEYELLTGKPIESVRPQLKTPSSARP